MHCKVETTGTSVAIHGQLDKIVPSGYDNYGKITYDLKDY